MSTQRPGTQSTAFAVLAGISVSHLLNDTVQSLVPAIYPLLKAAFALSFAQVGLMTLTQQLTASVLQPVVGVDTDRRPTPESLGGGMAFSLVGLLLLARRGARGCGGRLVHGSRRRVAAPRGLVAGDPGCAHFFKVLLPGEPDQLLHVLSDQQVPGLGSRRADRFIHLPGRGRRRYHH